MLGTSLVDGSIYGAKAPRDGALWGWSGDISCLEIASQMALGLAQVVTLEK